MKKRKEQIIQFNISAITSKIKYRIKNKKIQQKSVVSITNRISAIKVKPNGF